MSESLESKQMYPPAKKRIEWIDIAKGVAILLVIVGHTVKYGTFSRDLIFSFHMPLFFILSGYTYTPATDRKALWQHVKRHARRLLLPCLCVSLLLAAYAVVHSGHYSFSAIAAELWKMGQKLFYASGVPVYGVSAGMVWFIISLFWTKVLIDCIYTFQRNRYTYVTIGCLGFLGVCLGAKNYWLAQNLDVTLVSLVFFYAGMLWKRYEKQVAAYTPILFGLGLTVWSLLLSYGVRIIMASRQYPMYSVSILEALCASFVFCMFCKHCLDYQWIKRPLMVLGADSIIIFYLHHCDWGFKSLWTVKGHTAETICLRVSLILAVYLLIILLRHMRNKLVRVR